MACIRFLVIFVTCLLAAAVVAFPLAAIDDGNSQTAPIYARDPTANGMPPHRLAQAAAPGAGASGGGDAEVAQLRQAVLRANAERKAAVDRLAQAYDKAGRCWPALLCPATLDKWRLKWQKGSVIDRFEATLRRLPRLSASPTMLAALNTDVNQDSNLAQCLKQSFIQGSVRGNHWNRSVYFCALNANPSVDAPLYVNPADTFDLSYESGKLVLHVQSRGRGH